MKTLRTLLTAIVLLAGTANMNAQRMSYEAMCDNARFLTDRMAYTLGIRALNIIDDIYRINFDYIYGVNEYLDDVAMGYYYDDYMTICARRDAALRYLLGDAIWHRLTGYSYFYRPIAFRNHRWHFSIYDYDRYGRNYYHYAAPTHYHNHYAGGHFFGGMPPRSGHIGDRAHGYHIEFNNHGNHNNYNNHSNNHNNYNNNHNYRPQGNMNAQGNRPQGNMGNHNDRPQGNMGNSQRPTTQNSRPQGSSMGSHNDRPSMGAGSRNNNAGSRAGSQGNGRTGGGRR